MTILLWELTQKTFKTFRLSSLLAYFSNIFKRMFQEIFNSRISIKIIEEGQFADLPIIIIL